MSGQVPDPTYIYRLMHLENLPICLTRGGLHAPNHCPADGFVYRTIHDTEIQQERRTRQVTCGPGGVIHDYAAFYSGYLSPMLLRLHTNRVEGYSEGQQPLIYLISTAQDVRGSETAFVFSDGHGIARFTDWYDDLNHLDVVDWDMVFQRYWADTIDDMDRQRRKQAEFLVHRFCPWSLIRGIGVISEGACQQVEKILARFPPALRKRVEVRRSWATSINYSALSFYNTLVHNPRISKDVPCRNSTPVSVPTVWQRAVIPTKSFIIV